MDLPATVSECSLDMGKNGVCSDTSLIVEIDESLGIGIVRDASPTRIDPSDMKAVIDKAKVITKCDSEMCVLDSNQVRQKVDADKLKKNKETKFKHPGPSNNTKLLSNFNIDTVLKNLTHVDKHKGFYHMVFQMIDFNGSMRWPPSEMATTDICADIIEKGYNCMGVVLNTDNRSGTGKHWFCIFCDFRGSGSQQDPYTVEYFNSSGNLPLEPVLVWLNKTAKHISHHEFASGAKKRHCAKVVASRVRHQQSQTECGLYSLYYIWCRLNKEPIESFRGRPIPDAKMTEFRKHLFYDPNEPKKRGI